MWKCLPIVCCAHGHHSLDSECAVCVLWSGLSIIPASTKQHLLKCLCWELRLLYDMSYSVATVNTNVSALIEMWWFNYGKQAFSISLPSFLSMYQINISLDLIVLECLILKITIWATDLTFIRQLLNLFWHRIRTEFLMISEMAQSMHLLFQILPSCIAGSSTGNHKVEYQSTLGLIPTVSNSQGIQEHLSYYCTNLCVLSMNIQLSILTWNYF